MISIPSINQCTTHIQWPCQDERDQAQSDCIKQSMEISRLDEERSTILMKMNYYRQCIEAGMHRELMTSKENDMFKCLEMDMNTNSPRYKYTVGR